MKQTIKSITLSTLIIVLISLLEQVISGNGVAWFKSLDKPAILVPLNVFYIIAGIIALMNITILTRLFNRYFETKSKSALIAIGSVIILLLANAIWNYFFMGLENLRNGFIGMLLFLPIVIITLINLKKVDKISFWLYFLYFIWVVYDIVWTYQLWKMYE